MRKAKGDNRGESEKDGQANGWERGVWPERPTAGEPYDVLRTRTNIAFGLARPRILQSQRPVGKTKFASAKPGQAWAKKFDYAITMHNNLYM